MGMSTGGNKGGVQSEINVTPLIDVMLVLLIIFLVGMPIMMKKEALEVPRKLEDTEVQDDNVSQLVVQVRANGEVTLVDGENKQELHAGELAKALRPKLEALHAGTEKVVFVGFEPDVKWRDVVMTMDSIRSLAADTNHDDVKVALKVKDENAPH
jgi:biopolymer transport protein ExbD